MAEWWLRNLVSLKAVAAVLSSFGTLWLAVEMAAFFFDGTTVPSWLRGHWQLFAGAGVLLAVWECRPKTRVECKLSGRDVTVAIAIGDIFHFDGALIVGSNTTFDTRVSPRLIAEDSVQGAFTNRYYSDPAQLDLEIGGGLAGIPSEELPGPRQGKSLRYPIGTVVRVSPKGKTAYFAAIADINEHGVADGSFEKLQVALAELWVHIGSRGLKEALVIPALGTGFSRLPQTREQVVRAIVRSFVAACSERVFADRLTIVLSPKDVAKNQVSLEELGAFLEHVCVYTEFAAKAHGALGTPA